MIEKWDAVGYLKGLHTRQLLGLRDACYRCGGNYSPFDNSIMVSLIQVKGELMLREHIPNKKEAKVLRQNKARRF